MIIGLTPGASDRRMEDFLHECNDLDRRCKAEGQTRGAYEALLGDIITKYPDLFGDFGKEINNETEI